MKADLTSRVLPRYETKLAALLPTLHMIQYANGWIPGQAMLEIAAFLNLQPSEVMDTASFYEEYWIKPRGRQIVSICRSIACEACNYQAISEAAKASLGLDIGETTDVAAQNPAIVDRMLRIMREQHVPSKLYPFKALDN